jgi:hypothetical protein
MNVGPLRDVPLEYGWWCGCSWATQDDYQHVKKIYEHHSLANYKFAVENNLRRVQVTSHSRAACGLWTLASMMVRYDLTPRQVAGMATKMRCAVELHKQFGP